MRIEVTGRHMEITPAILEYAETKCGKLTRYFDRIQEIVVVVTEQPKPEQFDVEIRVDVEHHDDFVGHAKGQDLYEAIDLCIDKVSRQLTEFKERLKNSKR